MKIKRILLHLIVGVSTLSCAFSCACNSHTPAKTSTTTIQANNIQANNSFAFECTSEEEFTVDWGDSTTNDEHNASHVYSQNLEKVTITITGAITEIRFADATSCFANNNLIDSIQLGDTITNLPDYSCAYLDATSIQFTDSLATIGEQAFNNCSNLKEVIIPESVSAIGNNVFLGCDNLIIYCRVNSKPAGWSSSWNPLNYPCYWGYISHGNENNFNYVKTNTGLYISKYNGTEAELNIPETISGDSVVGIGDQAFKNNNIITSVTLSKELKSIGSRAFDNCSSLKEIFVPECVNTIKDCAFDNCINLTIYCETTSKKDGWDDTWNICHCPCYWGYISKDNNQSFNYVVTKAGIFISEYVGTDAIVTVPATIQDIQVVGIGDQAFRDNENITLVALPNTLKSIGTNAFDGCISLQEIIIPQSVDTIGAYAFDVCDSLIIYCETTSKKDGWDDTWNIYGCPCYWGYISKGTEGDFRYVKTSSGAFILKYVGTDKIVTIPGTIQSTDVIGIGDYAFKDNATLESVILPSTLKSIGGEAFTGCYSLKGIVIPLSVLTIGSFAFRDCFNISIFCEAESKPIGWADDWNIDNRPCYWGYISYISDGDLTYVEAKDGLFVFKYSGSKENLTIPSEVDGIQVVGIGGEAFKNNSTLESITLPSTLKSIGDGSFVGCSSLIAVAIPDSVELIGSDAFAGCSSLRAVIIPDSVITIGYDAFTEYSNPSLAIFCEAASKPIGWSECWSDCPCYWGYISQGTLGGFAYAKTTLGIYIFLYEGDSEVSIPERIDNIAVIGIVAYAFKDNTTLESVTLPSTLKSIGREAFAGCLSLETINIPQGVETIGDFAFINCVSLKIVIIPESVSSIGYGAFRGCEALIAILCIADSKPTGWADDWNWDCPAYWGYISYGIKDKFFYVITSTGTYIIDYDGSDAQVTIPEYIGGVAVVGIGDYVFNERENITSVTLPATLKSIGKAAFRDCLLLENVNIPQGVETIGAFAFEKSASLSIVIIPKSVTTIGEYAFSGCGAVIFCESESGPAECGFDWNFECPTYLGYKLHGITDDFFYVTTTTGVYIASYIGSDPTVTIPMYIDGVEVVGIGDYAFMDKHNITSIVLPSTLKSIGTRAFEPCTSLQKIIIPKNVDVIYENAFADSINTAIFCEAESKPEGWHENWMDPAYFCDYWGYISDGTQNGFDYVNTKTGMYIYDYENSDSTITVPDYINDIEVTGIGKRAFLEKTSITSVILPNTLKLIEEDAFFECSNLAMIDLTSFTNPTELPTAADNVFCDENIQFKVSSIEMANAFIAKGGGWPNDPARYIIG